MKLILERDDTVGMIYLVSGTDIPVQPPEALFRTRQVVTEGQEKTVVPFTTVIGYNPEDSVAVRGEALSRGVVSPPKRRPTRLDCVCVSL
jgi:hypothetical protein